MAKHQELVEPNAIHPAAFVGNTDPSLVAANEVLADKLWIDTTLPAPYILKKRDATNTFWEVVGGGTGSSASGPSNSPPPFEGEEPEMPWINPGGGSVSGGSPGYAATTGGQVLFSLDGATFVAQLPVTDPAVGWLVDGVTGLMMTI